MPYRANLIRASNAGRVLSNSNSNSLSSELEITPSPPVPQPLPELQPGFVYYYAPNDMTLPARLSDGVVTGQLQRLSQPTLSTLALVQQRPRQERIPGSLTSIYCDCLSPDKGWLLEGWIAEKRILQSGTTYWVYYSPDGNQYRTRQDLFRRWGF